MSVVMSPSGLSTFKQCPLRFYAQSVIKAIPWKDSPAKARGTAMHSAIEAAMQGKELTSTDAQVDMDYVRRVIAYVQELQAQGYALEIEKEMCMAKNGEGVDWWSVKGFLRAKADVFLMHPDPAMPVVIGDIKTGRVWDRTGDQLRLECLLAHVLYGRTNVKWMYWYIDQGETVEGVIDFAKGTGDVADLYELMAAFRQSVKNNYWPAQSNKFCRFCSWHKTENCTL